MRIWWWQTTWVVLVPITTHLPSFINVVHTELWIFDHFDANELLNMHIWWWQTTWVVLVPITTHIPSFINVAHTKLWIFDFFVISQSEQICKWGLKYAHSVTTDHVGSTCAPPHYPHTKFDENRSLRSHLRGKVYLLMLMRSDIHPSVHTYMSDRPLQMKTKWSFQHSWRPTTSKQTNKPIGLLLGTTPPNSELWYI